MSLLKKKKSIFCKAISAVLPEQVWSQTGTTEVFVTVDCH